MTANKIIVIFLYWFAPVPPVQGPLAPRTGGSQPCRTGILLSGKRHASPSLWPFFPLHSHPTLLALTLYNKINSISENWVRLWQTPHVLTSPALAMRKPVCLPKSKTYCSVCISHNPASLGRRAFNSCKREGLRWSRVLNSPTSHTYMEPSLFSNQCICQNCFFAATCTKVRSSGARALHSCISLRLRFPVLESRAWICLIQAILCVCERRGNICYCHVPSRHLAKQSAIGINVFFLLLNSLFPPIIPIRKNKLFSH